MAQHGDVMSRSRWMPPPEEGKKSRKERGGKNRLSKVAHQLRRKGMQVPPALAAGEGHIPPSQRSVKGKFEYLLMMKRKPGVDFAKIVREVHMHEDGMDNGFIYCAPARIDIDRHLARLVSQCTAPSQARCSRHASTHGSQTASPRRRQVATGPSAR